LCPPEAEASLGRSRLPPSGLARTGAGPRSGAGGLGVGVLDSGKGGIPGAGFLESCTDSYYDYLRIVTEQQWPKLQMNEGIMTYIKLEDKVLFQ